MACNHDGWRRNFARSLLRAGRNTDPLSLQEGLAAVDDPADHHPTVCHWPGTDTPVWARWRRDTIGSIRARYRARPLALWSYRHMDCTGPVLHANLVPCPDWCRRGR